MSWAPEAAYATALGSWPGTDFAAAQRLTFGEVPDLPYLVELPARGTPAAMIGRTGALLAGLGLDLQPAGWRLTDASGIDHRRAKALWRQDLDVLEETAQGYAGPFKIAVTGPWTMASLVEKPRGDKVVADHGARRDLAESLAAGVGDLLNELDRRLPELELVVQVDDPLAARVNAGKVATASGFGRHRRVDDPELSQAWERLLAAIGERFTAIHSCAAGLGLRLAYDAGFDAIAMPLDLLGPREWDVLGPALESGKSVWLGAVTTETPDIEVRPDRVAERALRSLRALELGPTLAPRVALTPDCGLAGWSVPPATRVLRTLGEAAKIVTEELGR